MTNPSADPTLVAERHRPRQPAPNARDELIAFRRETEATLKALEPHDEQNRLVLQTKLRTIRQCESLVFPRVASDCCPIEEWPR